jgi:hypothetical protein
MVDEVAPQIRALADLSYRRRHIGGPHGTRLHERLRNTVHSDPYPQSKRDSPAPRIIISGRWDPRIHR